MFEIVKFSNYCDKIPDWDVAFAIVGLFILIPFAICGICCCVIIMSRRVRYGGDDDVRHK